MVTVANDLSATGQVFTGGGQVQGAVLVGGSAAATLTLYDGTGNTGRVLLRLAVPANDSRPVTHVLIPFTTGVYAEISGTGAKAVLYL